MSIVMMGFGPHLFGINQTTYQGLTNSAKPRIPSSSPVGAAPLYQYLGPDEQRVTLDGLIYPEWFPGYDGLSGLREAARAGETYPLVSGLGDVFGNWLLQSVDSTEAQFNRSGTPKRVEFQIAIVRAGSKFGMGGVGFSFSASLNIGPVNMTANVSL